MICPHCGKDSDAPKIGPSIDSITAEIEEKGYSLDALKFWEYYDRNGWKRKDGSPITSWKEQLRVWDHLDKKRAKG